LRFAGGTTVSRRLEELTKAGFRSAATTPGAFTPELKDIELAIEGTRKGVAVSNIDEVRACHAIEADLCGHSAAALLLP
jgi:hypothetical protein